MAKSCEVAYMHRLLENGNSISEVARRLGRSRQTIYNWLQGRTDSTKPISRPSKLEPFKAYIRSRLDTFDLPATTLLREIRDQGYTGQITILKDFIRPIKEGHVRRIVERFETEPGRQCQVDWASCGYVLHHGRRRRLSLFALVFGHSRYIWARFVVSEKRPVLFECLESSFRELGAVHKEMLLDNMKTAVLFPRAQGRPAVLQPAFQDFADHWGFDTVVCPPYWPRAKGKIERAVGYIEKSFLEGRAFTDLDDLNGQLRAWLAEVANVRVHGTTKERPIDRLPADLAAMRPITDITPYPTTLRVSRRADHDARISFQGVRYSVDPQILVDRGRGVEVMVHLSTADEIRIYHQDRLVGVHIKRPSGSPPQDDPQHARSRRQLRQKPSWERPRTKTPAFAQLVDQDLDCLLAGAPVVQERSLDTYEGRS